MAKLKLDGYQFDAKLAEGGMAVVYRGQQLSLQRPVAIKVLKRRLRHHDAALQHFLEESLIIARLNHPNIIHVIDRGVSDDGVPFFIMELVDGRDLKQLLAQHKLNLPQKLKICLHISKAISYAHHNGIVHRDIKPANILINRQGNAKVLDFGIAHLQADDDQALSQNQELIGTPAYLAPEQRQSSGKITPAVDLYALGVVMYQMFTGHLPASPGAAPSQWVEELPETLDQLIQQCLQPDPTQRPKSAEVVAQTLLKLIRGKHLDPTQRQRAEDSVGRENHSFSLLDVLKENRFGAVYLFEEQQQRQPLVVKKRIATRSGLSEARRLVHLSHPNIAPCHGSSDSPKAFIVVMDYYAGGSLQDRLIRPFTLSEFFNLAQPMCQALQYAHQNRLIHGNLRPGNWLFDEQGQPQLSDFGAEMPYAKDSQQPYNAPEIAPSVSADIYACGVIFHQMLLTQLPKFTDGKLVRSRAMRKLPTHLQKLLLKMLAPDKDNRPPSASWVAEQLSIIEGNAKTQIKPEKNAVKVDAETTDSDSRNQIGRRSVRLLLLLCLLTANLALVLTLAPSLGEHLIERIQEFLSAFE